MRRVLNERTGLQLTNNDATPADIMDMYDMYISSPSNTHDRVHLAQAEKRIKFPLLPSQCIGQDEVFEKIGNPFRFSDGGRFLSDKNTVCDEDIPQVLEAITSLLKHDEDLIPSSENQDVDDIYIGRYDFLPSMFLHLAYHSRVDSGFRLLDRCARHTCDPKCESIYYQEAAFLRYLDEKNNKKGKNVLSYFYFILSSLYIISKFLAFILVLFQR